MLHCHSHRSIENNLEIISFEENCNELHHFVQRNENSKFRRIHCTWKTLITIDPDVHLFMMSETLIFVEEMEILKYFSIMWCSTCDNNWFVYMRRCHKVDVDFRSHRFEGRWWKQLFGLFLSVHTIVVNILSTFTRIIWLFSGKWLFCVCTVVLFSWNFCRRYRNSKYRLTMNQMPW